MNLRGNAPKLPAQLDLVTHDCLYLIIMLIKQNVQHHVIKNKFNRPFDRTKSPFFQQKCKYINTCSTNHAVVVVLSNNYLVIRLTGASIHTLMLLNPGDNIRRVVALCAE